MRKINERLKTLIDRSFSVDAIKKELAEGMLSSMAQTAGHTNATPLTLSKSLPPHLSTIQGASWGFGNGTNSQKA